MNDRKLIIIPVLMFFALGCASRQSYKFIKQPIPKGTSIGIIIDSKNDVKNTVIAKFMEKGFKVKAVNASDIYTIKDLFSIKDYKKLAYEESEIVLGSPDDSMNSIQKSYDSIYKLHVYTYETNKADMLSEMKSKWGIKYLVILELQDWEHMSWARTIDLDNNEIMAVENYPTKFSDKIDTVVDHFIDTIASM